MLEYIDKNFEKLLRQNHMVSFDNIWNLPRDWFEEPNIRRNGWSGVSVHTLNNIKGQPLRIVVKRQENHNFRSITHPLGRPTFYREYRNIIVLAKRNIPSLKAIYYGERKADSRHQAILITILLNNYRSLDELGKDGKTPWRTIITGLASLIRALHDAGFQHGSLYGKHILVATHGGPEDISDIRLIDLEKMRKGFSSSSMRARDISQLIRHTESLSIEYVRLFLQHYLIDRPRWQYSFLKKLKLRTVKKLKASADRFEPIEGLVPSSRSSTRD